jgi:hypothetical protein
VEKKGRLKLIKIELTFEDIFVEMCSLKTEISFAI